MNLSVILPQFSVIDLTKVESDLDLLLNQNRSLVAELGKISVPTWDSVMLPFIEANDKLDRFWSPISHLNSVQDSPALRTLYQQCLQKMVRYSTDITQNIALFSAFEKISTSGDFPRLSVSQQQSLRHALRDFRLAGVVLPPEKKSEFGKLQEKLSALQTKFSQNVLDATTNWYLHLTDQQDLAGLPETIIDQAHHRATTKDLDGWVFTLQAPSYIPFMQYARNRILRKRMYTAFVTRASDQGPNTGCFDNTLLIEKILSTRQQLATVLGYEHYAELSLQTRMAEDTSEVNRFLQQLLQKSVTAAKQEWQQLQQAAKDSNLESPVKAWDVAFYSEKLKQQQFHFSDDELRPYFPLNRVFQGLFSLVESLYSIKIITLKDVDLWHEGVCCYQINSINNRTLGFFYADLYARDHKQGGAWMAECNNRFYYQQHKQLPVAFLTTNFQNPARQQPALLSHDEVVTLFHEFGHTLHHLLTAIDLPPVAGINGVPWDTVELPSQFMENYCWQEQIIKQISGHYITNEPLPETILTKLQQARVFQSGLQMLRQIEFSLFDIQIHSLTQQNTDPKISDIQNILDHIRKQTSLVDIPDWNRFQHAFSHIFAGGYAAGYYSYKWAEVLAADVFSRFEEEGLTNSKTGNDFLEKILSRGGTIEPRLSFTNFRGRKPSLSALLRYSGLEKTD